MARRGSMRGRKGGKGVVIAEPSNYSEEGNEHNDQNEDIEVRDIMSTERHEEDKDSSYSALEPEKEESNEEVKQENKRKRAKYVESPSSRVAKTGNYDDDVKPELIISYEPNHYLTRAEVRSLAYIDEERCIYTTVIDCWTKLLNHNETARSDNVKKFWFGASHSCHFLELIGKESSTQETDDLLAFWLEHVINADFK